VNSKLLTRTSAPATQAWVDWTNLALGIFFLASPWLGLGGGAIIALNAVTCGGVIACVAVIALGKPTPAAEMTNVWLGLWLLVAPWILGFSGQAGATWASVLVGLTVACSAGVRFSRLRRAART
jgi:hypothetical protein